jgi:ribosomal protein S18 acetylase RimI-like enzyme
MEHRNTEIAGTAIDIRPARTADLPTVVALDEEATGMAKAEYWRERLERYGGGQQDRYFLLAERGGRAIGFIVGEVRAWEFGSPPSGWIFAINVQRAARQDGLGTLLFDAVCERFRGAGVRQVRTMIAKEDKLVMSFFRSQGMMAGPFIELEKGLAP